MDKGSLGGFTMSCGNPFNHLFQNIRESIFNLPKHDKNFIHDEEMECLQFGFCCKPMTSPRPNELFFGYRD